MLDVYNILPHVTTLPLPFRIVGYIFRIIWMVLTTLYAIPPYLGWTFVIFPVRFFQWELFWTIEGFLFTGLLAIMGSWLITGQYNIVETGDDINLILDDGVLLMANHQSTADVPAMMNVMHGKVKLAKQVMWIIDSTFKYTHFGLVSMLRGDFFIRQGKDSRDKTLHDLRAHLKANFHRLPRKWLVLFPEGGFLRKRIAASKSYARKKNLPILEHITLPRIGAMQVILEEMVMNKTETEDKSEKDSSEKDKNVEFKYVVDLTIAYPGGKALDIHGIGIGYWPPCQIVMHHRIYPISEVPLDTDGLTDWMNQRFIEKETLLDNYYKHGILPSITDQEKRNFPRVTARIMTPDLIGVLLFHTFYIISAYLQYKAINTVLNWFY